MEDIKQIELKLQSGAYILKQKTHEGGLLRKNSSGNFIFLSEKIIYVFHDFIK